MSNTSESETNTSVCANCGKEGSDVTNTCNKCMSVMYCNAACKKKHRHKHKIDCERRVAELHDEQLFKQPPPLEDCPICMIRIPELNTAQTYMPCCGKLICSGCVHAFRSRATKKEHDICPFCRTPPPYSDGEMIKRLKKRMELNDSGAICDLGILYSQGLYGLPQNHTKALEHWHWAGNLGYAEAYFNIALAYANGNGVERDMKKAIHYWKTAAMGGHVSARYFLGGFEIKAGNMERALKHFMNAVKDGDFNSLKSIKHLCSAGCATKDDHAKALQSYQTYLDEIKTDQRDEAASSDEYQKYY